jgi:pimeloyl-ACP methyl ester carboxylesterase
MRTAHVFILDGGMLGGQGEQAVNEGMGALAVQLERLPGVKVTTYTWGDYERIAVEHPHDGTSALVVVGYSGGGTRATYLAVEHPALIIDLMVLYDPSPAWQMKPIGNNVKRAIYFHNTAPMFGNLGGGVLIGRPGFKGTLTPIDFAEEHLFVQNDQKLHDQTIAAVKALIG